MDEVLLVIDARLRPVRDRGGFWRTQVRVCLDDANKLVIRANATFRKT